MRETRDMSEMVWGKERERERGGKETYGMK